MKGTCLLAILFFDDNDVFEGKPFFRDPGVLFSDNICNDTEELLLLRFWNEYVLPVTIGPSKEEFDL